MEYCNEIWKDVQGYEGLYQVSNLGRVKSVDHYVKCGHNSTRIVKGKILSLTDNGHGYMHTGLWKNNKGTQKYVHRLVAQAFIDNPNNYESIDHLNCKRNDNRVSNLEWVTFQENQRRSVVVKLKNNKKDLSVIKKPNHNGKTVRKVVQGKNIETGTVVTFNSMRAAERKLGICNGSISQGIKHGWKYGGYEWSLVK